MNVYDFDNTLYDGESILDFFLFCVNHHPSLVRFSFLIFYNLIKYKLCIISLPKFLSLAEKYAPLMLKACPDVQELAKQFWATHEHKLKPFYKDIQKHDDVIVSASFDFLLIPALERLGINDKNRIISSKLNIQNGKIEQLCFGENKITLYKKYFPNDKVDNFYTDSLNDKPFMTLATGDVYLVRKNTIEKYNPI